MHDSPIKPRSGSSGFRVAISYQTVQSVNKKEEKLVHYQQIGNKC